jgi:UDP:flavonoid glycosyltransferase YjiC (YdhE family)
MAEEMRFLFTCIPGLGHFNPIVPLARAAVSAGHEVVFVTAPCFAETVTKAGFACIPGGMDWDERRLVETVPELGPIERMYRGEWMMANIFLDRSPRRMVPDLLKIIPEWRPDVIIAGSFEYGGQLVAEKLGLPYANGSYTIRWNRWILKHAVGRAMAKLRAELGLPADPLQTAFGRYLDLNFAPPSWTFEHALLRPALTKLVCAKLLSGGLPLRQRVAGLKALLLQTIFGRAMKANPSLADVPSTFHFIGEGDNRADKTPPPAWLEAVPRQPTIFVSLGTILSAEYPEIFDKMLAGLRDKPVNLVMTMGGKADPARFGPQPANVRIVDFMTQDELAELLPHVDLCINHAGYSSVMEALVRGIPLILLPLVSDAPMNTQMCLSDGVTPELPAEVWGLSPKGLPIIRAEKLTPAIIADAAMRVLEDPSYRKAAQAIQDRLAERPDMDAAVRLLEQLMREQRAPSA